MTGISFISHFVPSKVLHHMYMHRASSVTQLVGFDQCWNTQQIRGTAALEHMRIQSNPDPTQDVCVLECTCRQQHAA